MKNKPKEPPRIAVKFANMVFVLGILCSILLVVYAIYKIYNLSEPISPAFYIINNLSEPISPAFYIISILSGGVFAALFGLGLKRLSNNLKVNLSMLFFTIGIAVYGFEIYLEFPQEETQREVIAKQMNVPYDKRTKMEVLNDLRDSGVKAFPSVYPASFTKSNGLTAKKRRPKLNSSFNNSFIFRRIYPLGTISNSTTIFWNESGYYPIIETDEHGFNNPKGLYEENEIDILLTGDSFIEGFSVHSDESISAVLRQLDFNTISIGKMGNGPLAELATLKEYAEPLKPKIVLWSYFWDDFGGLSNEMKSSILKKYLNEDDYSQNLISRQEEIDDVLINHVQSEWEKQKNQSKWEKQKNKDKERVKKKNERIINLLKLSKLRLMINLIPSPLPSPIFRDILQKSKQMVLGWEGKMYFVYLPSYRIYSTGKEDAKRDFVMQIATELDIPIIDIQSKVFATHPDPLSLFPFRMTGHYTVEGYKLVAEAIGERLEADGYVPIKSKK